MAFVKVEPKKATGETVYVNLDLVWKIEQGSAKKQTTLHFVNGETLDCTEDPKALARANFELSNPPKRQV